jgi:thiamine-phosphate pyrophosphorylase
MIQIRDKNLNAATLVARTRQALAIARRRDAEHANESSSARGAIVLVNDRVDVAAALGADGAHTGSDDLPTVLVRRVIGPERLLGRTAHDVAEARAAVIDGADYLGVGPCFPSTTKSFDACALPEFLSTVAREISLPTFAIGGITLQRLDSLARIGLTRVAVASAVTGAADPAAAAEALLGSLAGLSGRSPNAVGGLE